jgi:hypothetical protein
MKPILSTLLAYTIIAAPAAAQEYYGPPASVRGYDGYYNYDPPVPPLPVPTYQVGTTHTVVTTRRIVSTPQVYGGYGGPETIVTRRVLAPRPVLDEGDLEVSGSV